MPEPCEAFTYLPLQLRIEILRTCPDTEWHQLPSDLTCALSAHPGTEHHAVAYDDFPARDAAALWIPWQDGTPPDTFRLLPDCPARSPGAAVCTHFTAHPGPHSWEPAGRGGR